MEPKIAVDLRSLTKHFEKVVAVDNISLQVIEGEFLTLLGPSGSGKTTTLMMVAGFEHPTSGEILFKDRNIALLPPFKRNIGMVFQNFALFPHMTVFENVAFPLKMRGTGSNEIKKRIRRVLDLVQLKEFEARYPKQLSGGQQQRVALARAVVYDPPLMLMDEPLGSLDKKLREYMQIEIRNIQRSLKITCIYVTHDQQEALTMSDRIAVFNSGKIQQVGTPDELYEQPSNRFVADFIGDSNFIAGKVAVIAGRGPALMVKEDILIPLPGGKEFQSNQKIELAVRPERIKFAEKPDSYPVVLEGIVEEVIYKGEVREYRIEISRGIRVGLKQQISQGIKVFEKGDRVNIGWNLEDSRIFEEIPKNEPGGRE